MRIKRMVDFAPFLVDLTTQKCGLNNSVLTRRLGKVDLATQLWTERLFLWTERLFLWTERLFLWTERLLCGLNDFLCGLLDRPVDFETKLFTAFSSHPLFCFWGVKRTKKAILSIYVGFFHSFLFELNSLDISLELQFSIYKIFNAVK